MRNLNYQLKQLCARNRDGSLGIRAKRQRPLNFAGIVVRCATRRIITSG